MDDQNEEKCRRTPYTKLPLEATNSLRSKFRVQTESTDSVLSAYSADDAIEFSGKMYKPLKRPTCYYTALCLLFINVQLIGFIIYHFCTETAVLQCTGGEDVPRDALLVDHGVFSELNLDEIRSVEYYMKTHSGIDLEDKLKIDQASIALIELWLPKKYEALEFFDRNGSKPDREARVVVIRGDEVDPKTEEYIVTPLPDPARHRLLTYSDDRRENPMQFHTRPSNFIEWKLIREIVHQIALKADRLLQASYKMSAVNCDGKNIACIRYDNAAPGSLKAGVRQSWYRFLRDEDGHYLHPTAFQFLIDFKSKNSSDWKPIQFYYEGHYHEDVDDILKLFDQGLFERPAANYDLNLPETNLKHRGQPMPDTPQMGPKQYYPQGKRYTVNGNSISYLNWRFDYSFFSSLGLQLYNVHFKNERIIYEIGAQEVAVLYSGITPVSYTTNFFDSQYLLGAFSFEMVPDVDCPKHASFLDVVVFKLGRPVKLKNAICVFEHSNSIPLRRHYEMDSYNFIRPLGQFRKIKRKEESYYYYGGLNDDVLIVRTIAALFNYDYIFDYIFHNNGAMEARVTPTGYIHAAPLIHDDRQWNYGFRVFANALGSIHNHLIHFKVDMDIKGIENRFETLDIVPDKMKLEWTNPPTILHQRRFERRLRITETKAAIKYNFDKPTKYLITNANKTDSYGNTKSWQLSLEGMTKLLLPEGESVEPGLSWARYQLAITKRKDNERSSSSLYNGVDPYEAVVKFNEYIADDENIVDKDLVAWASLGMMHIPGTVDVPNTPTTNGHLTLRISPYNYFTFDPSISMRDSVYIKPGRVDIHGDGSFIPCMPKYEPFEYDGREIEL